MNIESFRDYCLSLKGTTDDMPFDESTLVFKVMGKMFALTNIDTFESINLKCNPEKAIELREQYDGIVLPGYHMNKQHWNTIIMDDNISDAILKSWIKDSYDLVAATLTIKMRNKLDAL